jgi:endonuclease/exonuclease/phosphatase family metal-dependent hydrolase
LSRSDIAVASMNMHGGVGSAGQPFDIEGAIRGLEADVVALQETWSPESGPDPLAAAAASLGAELFRVPLRSAASLRTIGIPADSGPGHSGLALLCRHRVTGHELVDLGQMRGDPVRRHAQVLTIELPDRSVVRIAATHLTHRLVSPIQLARLIRHLDGVRVPTVIAGDLNMPGLLASLARGYTMAVRGRTWPAELPVTQLDHILAGQGIEPVGGSVLPAAGSDHLPVRARLRLAPGRAAPN